MYLKTIYKFLLFLSKFWSLKGEECFTDGVTWTNEFVPVITPSITTIFDCLDLCKKTADCKAFSWINKEHPLFPKSCLTYTNSSQPVTCEECTSGRLEDCQLCSQALSCSTSDNLVSAVSTTTELECQYVCARTALPSLPASLAPPHTMTALPPGELRPVPSSLYHNLHHISH